MEGHASVATGYTPVRPILASRPVAQSPVNGLKIVSGGERRGVGGGVLV